MADLKGMTLEEFMLYMGDLLNEGKELMDEYRKKNHRLRKENAALQQRICELEEPTDDDD